MDRCGSVKTVLRSFGGARGTFFGLKLLPVEFTLVAEQELRQVSLDFVCRGGTGVYWNA